MKLDFEEKKKNTSSVQFRIDPDTKKKLTALKKYYKRGTGTLIKKMICQCHDALAKLDK